MGSILKPSKPNELIRSRFGHIPALRSPINIHAFVQTQSGGCPQYQNEPKFPVAAERVSTDRNFQLDMPLLVKLLVAFSQTLSRKVHP